MNPDRSALEVDVPLRRRRTRRGDPMVAAGPPGSIPVDRFRNVVFPNRIRERRMERGQLKLLPFARVPARAPATTGQCIDCTHAPGLVIHSGLL